MNPELHEAILSLKERFHALKAEMDVVHQLWQTAVREQDFDRQSSLIAYKRGLILEASAVIDAFQHLIAQGLMHTKR